jgi:phospholipid/cholesterol/gamma-HCH transport system substrate-binding protein
VAYQGVDIGRVQSIDVAPDPAYIMVTMRIYRPDLIRSNTMAQIDTTGIAGAAYINLFAAPAGGAVSPPRLDFPVSYPVIPTQPSALNAILASAEQLTGQLQSSDIAALVGNIDATVKETGALLAGPQVRDILANLQTASRNLSETAASLSSATSQGDLAAILKETRSSLAATQELLATLRSQVDTAQIPRAVAMTRQTVSDLDAQTRLLAGQVGVTMENLQQASDTLNKLLQRLYLNPSALLASQSPAQRQGTR